MIPGQRQRVRDQQDHRTGTFIGRCAELCGVDHDRMDFIVKVVPAKVFDAYDAHNYDPKYLAAAARVALTQGVDQ